MAGYLITMKDMELLRQCVYNGVYSTFLSAPRYGKWGVHHEGTFADYLSMKPGDLIFFFNSRKIYGCGEIIQVGSDCKYLNYKEASYSMADAKENFNRYHVMPDSNQENRCLCLFKPSPFFFKEGVDMDEVLQNKSCPFHSVRTMWKLSFIKLDDEESKALQSVILKHNEENLLASCNCLPFDDSFHNEVLRITNYDKIKFNSSGIIASCLEDDFLKHEMALEASLCEILTKEDVQPFGKWDYISHQVVASPFKPIDYMDKMDIFGYKYIPGYDTVSKYIIAELKVNAATEDVIEQIMKYVDWVSDEYANGDYSMIQAYVVAYDFDADIIDKAKKYCIRNFNKGFRPTKFCIWDNIKLVKYYVEDGKLKFRLVYGSAH